MPYVEKKVREGLDGGCEPTSAGELTYCLQQQIKRYLSTQEVRFENHAVVLGALEAAKADYVRRVLTGYEVHKQVMHGDVW
jgi:hypothetical protein